MAPTEQQSGSWLVLLTPAPSQISFSSLKSTFEPALTQTLQEVSAVSKALGIVQDVDIALQYSADESTDPRSSRYSGLQNLLGQMYKLVCVICTRLAIDVEYNNEVNARILLLEKDIKHGVCMFNMQSLAACHRPWKHIMAIHCDQGQRLVETFLRCRELSHGSSMQEFDIRYIDAGDSNSNLGHDRPDQRSSASQSANHHYSVAVGGTFDHLHIGHKLLLTMTSLVIDIDNEATRTLTIGITGDALLEKKQYAEYLQTWDQRQECVRNFLLSILESHPSSVRTSRTINDEANARSVRDVLESGLIIDYVEIFDPFGPTITEEEISALVISEETRSGGNAINDRRKGKGWAPLEVFEVDVLDAGEDDACGSAKADFQDKISSTEIRRKLHLRHERSSAPTE